MKNKRGFTLIELLAVIVILAIIALIAVPIVLNMINNARKNAAKSAAYGYVDAIEYNNGFAQIQPDKYTLVTGENIDVTGINIKVKGKKPTSGTVTVNDKGKVTSATDLCFNGYKVDYDGKDVTSIIKGCSESSNNNNNQEPEQQSYKCRKATELHTSGNTTFGTLVEGNTLKPGDALDCKVTTTGDYTERFYYVTDLEEDSDYAVLIYYNNTKVDNGKLTVSNEAACAYDSSGKNYYGPQTAKEQLPTTTHWDNISLSNTTRAIKAAYTTNNYTGAIKATSITYTDNTSGGTLPTDFSYAGKAARLLTFKEVMLACGLNSDKTYVTDQYFLGGCRYLTENYVYHHAQKMTGSYWLETPEKNYSNYSHYINTGRQSIGSYYTSSSSNNNYVYYGARPVIEVLKDEIDLGDSSNNSNVHTTSKTESTNIEASNAKQTVKISDTGKYKLEVWGASGGSTNSSEAHAQTGGYGGYSVGYVNLNKDTNLYVYVGAKGEDSEAGTIKNVPGGYNGGGDGYVGRATSGTSTSGGGGATHIALVSGPLSSLSSQRDQILIVAGGGGGSHTDTDGNGYDLHGGNGGGYIGTSPTRIAGTCSNKCMNYTHSSGGTQSTGGTGITKWDDLSSTSSTTHVGTFGKGATGNASYGGGGGGYFGGASGHYYAGGGGSSYISSSLSDAVMYCYNCEENDTPATKTIRNNQASENPEPMKSKIGNGYARITYISG